MLGQQIGILALAVASGLLGAASARADSVVDWGYNDGGVLGNGTTGGISSVPVAVSGLSSGVTAIAGGYGQSLAIRNGGIYAWGWNGYGQLGDGTFNNSSVPVAVSGLSSGVTAIAGGGGHSLAIQNGSAYAWGYNGDGELGNGTTGGISSVPVAVSGLSSGVTAIAGGGGHSVAIQNGGVCAWGFNEYGQLGNGTTNNSSAPSAVSGLSSGVTVIAAGDYHSLAIQNGGAYAWGYNCFGQLGNGTTTNSSLPVVVAGLSSGVTAVAGGYGQSLAIQNGGVYAWGLNGEGELGDGTHNNQLVPERIDPADLKNIIAVAAGVYSSYALASDGTIWDWGFNPDGALGLGNTNEYYFTPQHLMPPSGYEFTAISANADGALALLSLAVPEPASLSLLGVAAAGLMAHRRRGRNRVAARR